MRHFNRTFPARLWQWPGGRRSLGRTPCVFALLAALLPLSLLPLSMQSQPHPAGPAAASHAAATSAPAKGTAANEKELGATQEQLMSLLRVSPTLANVLASDPALLSNQDYVSRNNPELADFLQAHPEVARNPSFFLFSNLRGEGQKPYSVLEPKRGFAPHETTETGTQYLVRQSGPFLVMIFIVGALLWLIRLLLENRRWGRAFKAQAEVHGKLIDKFGTSQEMLAYMETDAGKRFLEAAPIATDVQQQRIPNLVARVIGTLQIGVVLTLLGLGFLFLRHSVHGGEAPVLILAVLVLMPGIGFMISAGVTWVLARRLGLIQDGGANAIASRERP